MHDAQYRSKKKPERVTTFALLPMIESDEMNLLNSSGSVISPIRLSVTTVKRLPLESGVAVLVSSMVGKVVFLGLPPPPIGLPDWSDWSSELVKCHQQL